MGQKQIKQYRKAAEKTAKSQAFILAQAQIQEIMKAPWKIRWRFCQKILFPPKSAKAGSMEDITQKARGI